VGLFGGDSESSSKDFSGSQNQGFSDVEAGDDGIINVGSSGGKNTDIRVFSKKTDFGSVRRAFNFAEKAIGAVERTHAEAGASQQAALDVVKGLKSTQLESQGKQLGTLVVVGLLGLGAIQLIAARSRSQ